MFYTVYRTVNKVNNKEYVGFHKIPNIDCIQTECSKDGSIFKDGYMGSGKLIKRALEKYGPINMYQQLLFVTEDKQEAEEWERDIVDEKWTLREDTYNINLGGNVRIALGPNNGFWGKHHTEETINRIQKSRNETYNENPFSWSVMYDCSTNKKFLNRSQVKEYYHIEEASNFSIRKVIQQMVCDGIIRYESVYLQEVALRRERLYRMQQEHGHLSRTPESRQAVSKRFKGIPKSKESNLKRGESISTWIAKNPEKHAARMEKINKNPEKIRKTAEKHRGTKRSEETRAKLREMRKGCVKYINKQTHQVVVVKIGSSMNDDWAPLKGFFKTK